MYKTKLTHKNYTENQSGYQLKLPLNLEIIIPENDSVRLLSQFVEEMDLTDLYSTYEKKIVEALQRRKYNLRSWDWKKENYIV